MKKQISLVLLEITAIVLMLLVAGCAPGPNPALNTLDAAGKTAGFWWGLWHGIISPVTFIISLFNKHVNIYDVYNDGNWYNFGFILGVLIIFGGGGQGAKRKAKKSTHQNV
ncbi:MAG: hypothetical protein WCF70_05880 [Dehalococcoidales bacterium]